MRFYFPLRRYHFCTYLLVNQHFFNSFFPAGKIFLPSFSRDLIKLLLFPFLHALNNLFECSTHLNPQICNLNFPKIIRIKSSATLPSKSFHEHCCQTTKTSRVNQCFQASGGAVNQKHSVVTTWLWSTIAIFTAISESQSKLSQDVSNLLRTKTAQLKVRDFRSGFLDCEEGERGGH